MYSSEPKERLILWNTEPTSNPPADHYFVWIKDGKLYTLDSQGVQKEYATIEELSAKVNTSDIVDDLNSVDTDKPLSANQGKVLQDSKEDADNTILKEGDVENSLNSTSTTKPLSANQGKQLNDDKASLSAINNDENFYEEGTFTPILSFGGGTTGIEYDRQFGAYIKLGDMVFIRINIRLTSKGSDTGDALITLPFGIAELGGSGNEAAIPVASARNYVDSKPTTGLVNSSRGGLVLADEIDEVLVSNTNFTDTSSITCSGMYKIT